MINYIHKNMKALTINKRARYDYELLDKLEAGLVLSGHEVKATKQGKMSLRGSFIAIKGEEAWLINAYISPYQPKNTPADYNPSRSRKLLLQRKELGKLKGLTLIPLRVYNKNRKLKLEFAIARGKKKHDKREYLKKREYKKEIKGLL